MLACFAVAAYAVTRVLGQTEWRGVLLWFVACVVLHDVIGWPLYTAADRMLVRRSQRPHTGSSNGAPAGLLHGPHRPVRPNAERVPWTNHVRFPVVISGVLLGMFFPLILRISKTTYPGFTGFSEDAYLMSWLEVSGILFVVSAVVYLARVGVARWRSGRRPPGEYRVSQTAPAPAAGILRLGKYVRRAPAPSPSECVLYSRPRVAMGVTEPPSVVRCTGLYDERFEIDL